MVEHQRVDGSGDKPLLEIFDPRRPLQRALEVGVVVTESVKGSPQPLSDLALEGQCLLRLAEEQRMDVEEAPEFDDGIRMIIDTQIDLDVATTPIACADSTDDDGCTLPAPRVTPCAVTRE